MLRKIQVGDGVLWKKLQNVLILKHKFIHLNNEYLISSLALVFCVLIQNLQGETEMCSIYTNVYRICLSGTLLFS